MLINKKLIPFGNASYSLVRIITDIRQACFASMLDEKITARSMENIQNPYRFNAFLVKLKKTEEYKLLEKKYSEALLSRLTVAILYLEEIISLQAKHAYENNGELINETLPLIGNYKLFADFIKQILETTINNSFYHTAPVTIYDLEVDQLLRILKTNTPREDIYQKPDFNLKATVYVMANLFIKYLIPEKYSLD